LLAPLDRLSWGESSIVILDDPLEGEVEPRGQLAAQCLEVLSRLADEWDPGSVTGALEHALRSMVEIAGAESGYLLTEVESGQGWEKVAKVESRTRLPSRVLISDTVVNEAIRRRRPVHM